MPLAWRAGWRSSPRMKRPMRHAAALLVGLVLAPLAARAQAPDCGVPQTRADGWRVATPQAVGLDPGPLCAIGPKFASWQRADVHAILIARHGSLVYEHYFKGEDEDWGTSLGDIEHGPDTLHDLRSVGKSVNALILGIAIDRGWVPGVDTPLLQLLPRYADLRSPKKDRIRLRDVLTMSMGLKWDQWTSSLRDNSEIQMDNAADPYRYVLSQPVWDAPGTEWNYSSGGAALITAVLQQATGKPEDVLAQQVLFAPLGITNVAWHRWRNGDANAESGLRMLPRDLLKIGQLVLNRGAWNGRQIVSAAWIDAATKPQIRTSQQYGASGYSYGYQWWIGHSQVNGQRVDWPFGNGLGGQRLFVVPQLDMVVLVMAGLYDSAIEDEVPLMVLNNYAFAAVH